jgi:hypothetical protein
MTFISLIGSPPISQRLDGDPANPADYRGPDTLFDQPRDALCLSAWRVTSATPGGFMAAMRIRPSRSPAALRRILPVGAYTYWKAPPLHGAHPNRSFS